MIDVTVHYVRSDKQRLVQHFTPANADELWHEFVDFAQPASSFAGPMDGDVEIVEVDTPVVYLKMLIRECDTWRDVFAYIAQVQQFDDSELDNLNQCMGSFGPDKGIDIAIQLEGADEDERTAVVEAYGAHDGLLKLLHGEGYMYIPEVHDNDDFGRWFVAEYGLPENFKQYTDVDMLMNDANADVQVDDAQALELLESFKPDNLAPYFDYAAYGEELLEDYGGTYTSTGLVLEK